ncbi:hypothetical protein [Acidicapsa ligni]|uniref:hypothetical protein n=1 Tax=Acidicapsa ligni TaxID=542300 RepID=UPI0021DFD5AB|nr:hypothetical protein [Acidicapsa ligni]
MSTVTQTGPLTRSKKRIAQGGRKKDKVHRTTVTLSADAAQIVERFKTATGTSTSHAIEELILRSEPQKSHLVEKDGLLLLDVKIKDGKLTTERVKQLLEECPW